MLSEEGSQTLDTQPGRLLWRGVILNEEERCFSPLVREDGVLWIPQTSECLVYDEGDDVLGSGLLIGQLAMGSGCSLQVVVYCVRHVASCIFIGDDNLSDCS